MACEEKEQEMASDEIRLKLFNINYDYNLGLIKMNDVIRLIKTIYGEKDVSEDTHCIR